jgi:Sulfotransferase family
MTTSSDTARNGSERRVPDFFIVGNPKSGTTALYEMLERHPQIYMPPLGSQFFAVEQQKNPGTLDEYLSLFEPALPDQRAGEISRGYFRSRTAASGIAQLAPRAQIVVVLREPASFLRSLHMELLQDHVETEKDFGKAIDREEAKRRAQVTPDTRVEKGLMYSPERVAYVEQLRRFHAVFPREQVLVLIYDDFRSDNETTLRRVLRTLGVDHTVPLEVQDANPTVGVRSARMNELVRSLYMGQGPAARAAKGAIKTLTPRQLRREGLGTFRRKVLYGKPLPVDEELMLRLRRRSKEEVVALSEYLDRDLVTLWGYDAID